MTSTPPTVPTVPDLVFTDPERLALAGFLAGYRGLARDAYALDLRQFLSFCERHGLRLFSVRRTDIELYARALEEAGRARATVARRLCTVAGFYRHAEEEGLVPTSPAVHARRPRLDYESHAIGLDRNEVGAPLVAAPGAGAQRRLWPSHGEDMAVTVRHRLRRLVMNDEAEVRAAPSVRPYSLGGTWRTRPAMPEQVRSSFSPGRWRAQVRAEGPRLP